jgi:hypothetical protein
LDGDSRGHYYLELSCNFTVEYHLKYIHHTSCTLIAIKKLPLFQTYRSSLADVLSPPLTESGTFLVWPSLECIGDATPCEGESVLLGGREWVRGG